MCFSTRKQCKSCGAYASCVCQRARSLKVALSMHRVFQLGRHLKVAVSMHHVFINKKGVKNVWFLCIICLSTKKQLKSCGVYAPSFYQHGSGVIVAMFMFMIIKEVAVFKVSES